MRLIQLLLIPLFIAACDGVNPSMTNNAPGEPDQKPVIVQKPTTCKMDFANTCWRATIEKVTACIANSPVKDVFSSDREFCSNAETNKLVHFRSPADIFSRPFDVLHTPIEFKVYPKAVNECFSVTGTANNFEIMLKSTGERVQFSHDDDAMRFSCLDGQEVSIAGDKINGCQKILGGEFASQVPGMDFEPIVEQGIERGYRFRFRGAPETPDIFKCYNP